MRAADLSGGGRYKHPQAWIDHVIETDPALSNVVFSCPPRYSSRLKSYGQATLEEAAVPGRTSIGRDSLVSKRELLDTLIHEELHHRLWRRARRGSVTALSRIADLAFEEAYVEEVAYRFLRLQAYLQTTRKK